MAFDASGNLYATSYANRQLLKITAAGQLSVVNSNASTFFLSAPGPVAEAEMIPVWPAFDAAGDLYITDYSGCLWEVTPNGTIRAAAGFAPNFSVGNGGPAVLAGLNTPVGVAVAADGSLLFTEQFANRVRRVSQAGIITTVAGDGIVGFVNPGPAVSTSLYIPDAVAADSAGNIYIVSAVGVASAGEGSTAGYVYKVNSAGTLSVFYQAILANGIAIDAQGNLLVAGANQIVRVTPSGTATVIAGTGKAGYTGDTGPAISATFSGPTGVAADAAGNIYVADTGNFRIRKISASGTITTIGGGGPYEVDGVPATQSQVVPYAIASDAAGNVFFVEPYQARVREISLNGTISTLAGTGAAGFSGDGGLAASAMLNEPWGIAVDRTGNVYIADRINNRIREILTAPPSINVSESQVTVSAPSGGAPAQSSITVIGSIPGLGYSLSFSPQSGGNWLRANLTQGQAPGAFSVIADPTNLQPGPYQGTITVTSPYAVPATQSISVTFQVNEGTPPQLAVGNGPLSFSLNPGSSPATAQLAVSNQGGGTLSFTATVVTGAWLQVSPPSGTATAANPTLLTVTAMPGSLTAGTYSGSINVTSATTGQSMAVSVTLAIVGTGPNALLSQSGLTFTAVAQGGSPLPQNFGILNTGQGSMPWSAIATTLPAGGSWLSIDTNSGTVAAPYTDVSLVNVSVNPAGLTGGTTYYGQIQVTAPGAPNSPQTVSVVLNVLPAGSSPGAEIQPTGLIFIGQPGSSPGSQNVMISNPQASAITFAGTFFTLPTGGNWARFLPVNATVQPNAPVEMLVQPDYTNLTSGVSQGFVTLGFADGSTRSVSVLAVVAPGSSPGSSGAQLAPPGPHGTSFCSPIQIQPTSLTDPTSTVTVGVAASLQVRAVDNCGNLVTSSNGAVAASFNDGDASVSLVHVGNGNWSGTWTPRNGASTRVQIAYKALEGYGTSILPGNATITVAVQPANGTPLIFGASNAASGLSAYISPGGLVSVYGQQLASEAVTSGSPPFPTKVNGTQVMMGGVALPLRYVGGTQINAQVPFGLGINTQQQLIVQNDNALSVPQSLVVAAAQPGIYTQDLSGTGPGKITDYTTGNKVITASNPAHVGDTLVIYCNGLGAVTPAVPTGTPAPSDGTLTRTMNPVTVTIGGVSEAAQFAGLAPGFPDLYQVNAAVPAGVQPGDTVPVVLTVAGQSSPAVVTIVVK
jgi:uncharacterized protein (TIGR03437 family)